MKLHAPPAELPASNGPLPRGTAGGWTALQLLLAAAMLALLAAAAMAIDLPAAQWAKVHGPRGDLKRLISLGEVFGWGGTVALIVVTAIVLDPRGWRIGPRLLIGAFGAGLLADGCKLLLARQRPTAANLSGRVLDTFGPWLPLLQGDDAWSRFYFRVQSFPSGHSATAAGLAIALAALYPRGRWLFPTFAALAALQRFVALAHFPSDILTGAAIGCLVGAICAWYRPNARERN